MNVVRLEAGSAEGPAATLVREKPGLYVLQPDETAIRAMEAMLNFHRDPRPIIDYRGIPLPAGTIDVFRDEAEKAAKIPADALAMQAEIHARMAGEIQARLDQAVVGLELPFPETA